MARKNFEDWVGDLRELAREELGMDLEEFDFTDDDLKEAFKLGMRPKEFLRESPEYEGHERDLTEIMREL